MAIDKEEKEEDNEDDENNTDDEESLKRKNMSEEKQVVIKITPRVLERTIYIIIIIMLLAVIVIQNVSSIQLGGGNTETTTTQQEETTTTESSGGDGSGETSTSTSTSTTTTLSESQIASDDELKGKVQISFTSNPEISDAGKVIKVEFQITNSGPSFYPQVKLFWYDEADKAMFQNKETAIWPISTPVQIDNGVTRTYSINKFTRSYVTSDNAGETFVLKLYNRKTGTEITSASKVVSVS
ncbi:MAG: hypothetical protein V1740_07465 [Candidatus Woesearchaeota archaeon]